MSLKTIERMQDDWGNSVQDLQQEARRHYTLNQGLLSFHLGRHLFLILAAIVFSEAVSHWCVYIVAVMLIGAHQLGLGHIGYHERTHGHALSLETSEKLHICLFKEIKHLPSGGRLYIFLS